MSWVKVRLADPGASPITTEEFELKGHDSKVVKETELVKSYRKKGVIKTEPAQAPKKEKAKSSDEETKEEGNVPPAESK